MSDLMDEQSELKYVEEVKKISQMFVHQQYSGRVLVFMLLLGYICDRLAMECEAFLEQVEDILDLDVSEHCHFTRFRWPRVKPS